MMGALSVDGLANPALERATLWHLLICASSSSDSNRLDQVVHELIKRQIIPAQR